MSFQRDLTGSSNLYANVILNTNISASSVSTVNLSATNASFTNITTNTWTTGNVSTPNVIATNSYFSNLNTCNYNVCSVSTSAIYSSNASFTNVSITSKLTVPNISSLHNVFSDQAINFYSSGCVSIRDINQSNPALLSLNYASTPVFDTYGMVLETNKSGTKGYSKITAGQNLSFQVYADTVIQLENTSTTGWTFYTSINTSKANISNISSNAITTSTLGVSSLSASLLGISSLNVCSMYANAINDVKDITSGFNLCVFSNNFVVRDSANGSTHMLLDYDDATFTEVTGMEFETGQYGANISVQSTLPLTLFSGTTAQMRHTSTVGFSFYKPLYTSNIYSSNISCKNLDCNLLLQYASAYGDYINSTKSYAFYASAQCASVSAITGVSAIYTCIYCSNLSVSNLSVSNFAVGNLTVDDTINTSKLYASNVYSSNMSVGNRIDANRVVLTLSLDAPISNVSDSRVSTIKGISASFTSIYASEINTCFITVPSLITTNFSVSNLSASYLTSTSTFFVDMYATNIVTTGIVSTSYFSSKQANISTLVTTNVSVDNLSITDATIGNILYYKAGPDLAYETYATNGTLSGALFYNTLDTRTARHRFQYLGDDLLSINNSKIIAYKDLYSASSLFVSSGNICNFSVSNLSVTTLTTATFNPANISTGSLSITTAMTAVSGTVDRLYSTSTFVSNLSTSNISCSGRISVSNISATSISATGRITANDIRTTTDVIATNNVSGSAVYGGTLYASNINVSLQVNTSTVSCNNISSVSIATSWINASNASIITISGTTTNFSNVNASTLSFTNSLVNICVSNIYGSQIVLTQNGTVSQYGYMQYGGGKFFLMSQGSLANSLVMGNGGNSRFEISASGVSCYVPFYVSTGNFSTLNASVFNPANIVTTTLTASTLNASNLNASVFNPATINTSTINTCNLSVNNISSVYKITSDSIINVSCDGLYFKSIYASVGGIPYLQMDYWKSASSTQERGFTIFSDETRGSIIDGGTLALELRQDDITQVTNTSTNGWIFNNKINTSYQNNFSKLAVSNLSVSNITVPSITTATVTVSTINNSVINSDTGNIITLDTTTANVSTINSSTITNASGTFTTMSNNTIYSSIINVSRINNISSYVSNMSVSNFSCVTLATFANISSTSMRSTSYYGTHISVSNICVSYMSITRANVSNVCVSYVSCYDMTTETFNASSVTCDIAYPAYIVNTGGGNFSQICYFDNISVNNINNSISIDNPTAPLYINSTNNTAATGIRVPNYIDGQDLTSGFTIGYNQTTGFINCCRATRFYGNLLTDSNLNTITNTASLGIGQNITSGDIKIGSTTMTGNISIDTTGDLVFGCDRRSTWNTSDLIKFSTQLGSHVYSNSLSNVNKANTGQTFVFSPINANVSMTPFPVGLYLVSAHARVKTNGGYNANITQINAGMCYGTGYNFTSGNTTRMALAALGAINTSGTTNFIQNIPFTSVLNMSITGQYIGAFMSATAGQAATVGSIDLTIDYITIVKLA